MKEILCIGNPIVDVFIDIDKKLAVKYGITEAVQHIDRDTAEEILHDPSIDFSKAEKSSGGGAANVAKIAALLGMKSSFYGTTGQDDQAVIFEDQMKNAGVFVSLEKSDKETGMCFACSVDNSSELRFAACPGAALELNEENISEDMITSAELVVLDGYILDRRPLVQRVLLTASRKGIPVALDVASVFQVKKMTEEIIAYSRQFPLFIFMNADEAIVFFNKLKKDDKENNNLTEKEKEALILRDVSPLFKILTDGELYPIIVVKLGGRGAIVFAGGHMYHEETFTIIPRDTVGAGDAFCAGFISAWIRNKSISECAAIGNKVAREILTVKGTHIQNGMIKKLAKILQKPESSSRVKA